MLTFCIILFFFPNSPYVIVFYLYLLVICNRFGGMKHPKNKTLYWVRYPEKLTVEAFGFSLVFSLPFLDSKTTSEKRRSG